MAEPLITVTTEEVEALMQRLASKLTRANLEKVMLRLGGLVGAAAEARARKYPKASKKKLEKIYTLDEAFGRKVKPYLSIFKSAKQAAFVMLSIKAGKLPIPYRRTGTLGKSINHQVTIEGNQVIVTVGTNLTYAKFVIGLPPDQSYFHRGTWTPLQEAITSREAMAEYVEILRANLQKLINALLKE